MQQLKNQNGLLLQLVHGLQDQINSKNRENQLLFQQYEQLASDNSALHAQLEQCRLKLKYYEQQLKNQPEGHQETQPNKYKELTDLRQQCEQLTHDMQALKIELEQKGGLVILLESQLTQARLNAAEPDTVVNQESENKQNQRMLELQDRLAQLGQALALKEQTISQLTEYMNDQASKISQLTQESIAAITNYQTKLENKQAQIQQLTEQLASQTEQVNSGKNNLLQQAEENVHPEQITLDQTKKITELQELLHQKDESLNLLKSQADGQLQQLQEKFTLMTSLIDSRENQITELTSVISSMQESKQRQQTHNLENLKSFDKERQLWQQERQALEAQVQQLKMQLEKKPIDENNQESKAVPHESEEQISLIVQQMHVKLSTKEDQLGQYKIHLSQKDAKLSQLQQQIELLHQIIADKDRTLEECLRTMQEAREYSEAGKPEERRDSDFGNMQKIAMRFSDPIIAEGFSLRMANMQTGGGIQSMQIEQQLNENIQTIRLLRSQLVQYQQKNLSLEQSVKDNAYNYKDLEEILQSKDQTIQELTQFMNEQATRLSQLEQLYAQGQESLPAQQKKSLDDINRLERSLAEKEATIAGLTESLNQRQTKLSVLETTDNPNIDSHKLQQLQQILVSQGTTIQLLNTQTRQLEDRQSQLQAQVQKISQEHSALIAENEQLRNKSISKRAQSVSSQPSPPDAPSQRRKKSIAINTQFTEELKLMQARIVDLEDTVQNKAQTIRELSQYMNEQAHKLIELESKDLSRSDTAQDNLIQDLETKVKDLEAIIKSKNLAIQELTECLQENYGKVAQLESQISNLSDELKLSHSNASPGLLQVPGASSNVQSSVQNPLPGVSSTSLSPQPTANNMSFKLSECSEQEVNFKREMLKQLLMAIDQKELQLSMVRDNLREEQATLQHIVRESEQLDNLLNEMRQQQQLMQQAKGPKTSKQHDEALLEEKAQIIQSNTGKKLKHVESVEGDLPEKAQENDPSPMENIIQALQQQLAAKTEVVLHLTQQLQEQKTVASQTLELIQQLQQQNSTLKQQQTILNQKIYQQQALALRQGVEEVVQLEQQMERECQKCQERLKQELKQLEDESEHTSRNSDFKKHRSGSKNRDQDSKEGSTKSAKREMTKQEKRQSVPVKAPVEKQRESIWAMRQSEDMSSVPEEVPLTTVEVLSQLMLYSDEGANMRAIRVLIASLSEKYHHELTEYENESGQLKETVQSLIELNSNLERQMVNARQSIREKDQVIGELSQVNAEQDERLEEIRTSLSMMGEEVPAFLNKIFEGSQKKRESFRKSYRHSFRQSFQSEDPQKAKLRQQELARARQNELEKLKEEARQLRDELDKLREQSRRKQREYDQLHELRASNNKVYERQLEDLLMDSNIRDDPHLHVEQLRRERNKMQEKCASLEGKIKLLEISNRQKDEVISNLSSSHHQLQSSQNQLQNSQQLHNSSRGRLRGSSRYEENKLAPDTIPQKQQEEMHNSNVLIELEEPKSAQTDYKAPPQTQTQQDPPAAHSLEIKVQQLEEIIAELEDTILNLEKGYNDEIMALRRNIAQLDAEVLNLRKHLYLADPNALDVTELVKQTCQEANRHRSFYRGPERNAYWRNHSSHHEGNTSQGQPANTSHQNVSSASINDRSSSRRDYPQEQSRATQQKKYWQQPSPRYVETNSLGAQIMGKVPMVPHYNISRGTQPGGPFNLTINNEFRWGGQPVWNTPYH